MVSWVGCLGGDDGFYGHGPGGRVPFYHQPDEDAGGSADDAGSASAKPDADFGSSDLAVTSPAVDDVLKGTVTVLGTASADVTSIELTLAGMPMAAIAGTRTWTVDIDSTRVANGPQALEVIATLRGGDVVRSVVPVQVDNLAPIVGRWRAANQNSRCDVFFFPSGAFADPCGLFSVESQTWMLQGTQFVLVRGGTYVTLFSVGAFSHAGKRVVLRRQNNGQFITLNLIDRLDAFAQAADDAGLN
jgi:hypothetical protein